MRVSAYKTAPYKAAIFIVLALIFVYLGFAGFAYAQQTEGSEVVSPTAQDVETGLAEPATTVVEEKNGASVLVTNNFIVSPIVANEKAKPRDIIKKELLVTNNTQQRIDLYITVENIDPTEGAQEFVSPGGADLSTSLANWVEITRGVIELSPGESRKIPYLIHVNLTAKPGSYYARIQFSQGSRREETEVSKEGTALMLNVEVFDDAKERLQLGNFISNDNIVFGNAVSFSYLLENVGNRVIEPRGSIRIFNRRGEEVGSIPLNSNGEEISPDDKKQLATVWSAAGRFGKYKAFLDLEYGEKQLASVQDTVYFWVFPWKEILASLTGVVVLAIVGTYIVHMRAIARPMKAQVRQSSSRAHPNQEPSPSQVFSERISYGHRPTHVAVLRQSEKTVTMPSQAKVVTNHGVQVELAPRRSQPNIQGNVVQLPKRH